MWNAPHLALSTRHLLSRLEFPPVHLFSLLSESSGCSDTAVDEEGTPFTLSPEAHMKQPHSVWQQKVLTPSQRPSETESSNIRISYSSQKFFRDSGCKMTAVWLHPKGGRVHDQVVSAPLTCSAPLGELCLFFM